VRKIRTVLIWLVLLTVLFCGCVSDKNPPVSPITSEDTASSAPVVTEDPPADARPSFTQRAVGYYRANTPDSGEILLAVYDLGTGLLLETTEEYAAYGAGEWYPDDPAMLTAGEDTVSGTVFRFSGFSMDGAYFNPDGDAATVALTESGIVITEGSGTTVAFQRDDNARIHDAAAYANDIFGVTDIRIPEELVGIWSAEMSDGGKMTLRLDDNGAIAMCCQRTGEPVDLRLGISSTEDGTLMTVTERVGWGTMPWIYTMEYRLTDSGLSLTGLDGDGPIPGMETVLFVRSE